MSVSSAKPPHFMSSSISWRDTPELSNSPANTPPPYSHQREAASTPPSVLTGSPKREQHLAAAAQQQQQPRQHGGTASRTRAMARTEMQTSSNDSRASTMELVNNMKKLRCVLFETAKPNRFPISTFSWWAQSAVRGGLRRRLDRVAPAQQPEARDAGLARLAPAARGAGLPAPRAARGAAIDCAAGGSRRGVFALEHSGRGG